MKRMLRFFGWIFLLAGIILAVNSFSGITGFAVFEGVDKRAGSVIGISLIVGGLILILAERREESKERKDITILISRKAIDRSKRDNRIRQDISRYVHEIEMIKADPSIRGQKMIGEFHVSPRSKTAGGDRVAWHFDRSSNTLYIDDLLYHINDKDYVDKWNRKAANGKIKRADYIRSGYVGFTGRI